MNQYQFRAIRNSFERDLIYSVGLGWQNDFLEYPVMGKTIHDIKLHKREIKIDNPMYILKKCDVTYKLYSLDYKHTSQFLYVITKDDIIIYWITSSIFAPASSSWHILTEVYHGYHDNIELGSIWQWKSLEPFECEDLFMTKALGQSTKGFSSYTIDNFKKNSKYLIASRICTQEEVDESLKKMYYHL